MTLPLTVWGNRVLLREVGAEVVQEKAGTLFLPQQSAAQQRHNRWEIVAVGDTVEDLMLQPGLEVLISRWATEEMLWEGCRYRVAYAPDIVAVLS